MGTTVTVIGNGYLTSEIVQINFGTELPIATITANTYGTFMTTFVVNTQPVGTTTVEARGQITGTYSYFIITPGIIVTPTDGSVGTIVTVSGTGYGGSEPIRIEFGTNMSITIGISEGSGRFTTQFTVDEQCYGTHTVNAVGDNTGTRYHQDFKITHNIVYVTSITGVVGTVGLPIIVYGNGYHRNGTVTIGFGTVPVMIERLANINGTFSIIFTVNDQPYGSTTIKAYRERGRPLPNYDNEKYRDIDSFKIISCIWLVTPRAQSVGTIVTVGGNGYAGNAPVRITFGQTTTITQTTTNSSGTFSITFTVNTQHAGTHTIIAADLFDLENHRDEDLFKINSHITLVSRQCEIPHFDEIHRWKAQVGDVILIKGDGYGASELIQIDLGTTLRITTVTTSDAGTFATLFTVNTQYFGTKTIVATGINTGEIDKWGEYFTKGPDQNRYFVLIPEITIVNPSTGTVGTIITIKGTGFGKDGADGEKLRIDYGTEPGIFAEIIDPDTYDRVSTEGTFTAVFDINSVSIPQPFGTTTITVYGSSTSQWSHNYFFILPTITYLTPKTGTVGTEVTIQGKGYTQNANIRISFGNNTSITTAVTDASGTFSKTFTIDIQVFGTATATGIGPREPTNREQAWDTLQILPHIVHITPIMGTVGRIVTLYGNGYSGDGEVLIGFGWTRTITVTTANSKGEFNVTFTVDTQYYGTKTIYGTDTVSGVEDNDLGGVDDLFKIIPELVWVSPIKGTVGTQITLFGTGYGAIERVYVDFGTKMDKDYEDPLWLPAYGTTSSAGTFSLMYHFNIQQQAGTTTFTAWNSKLQGYAEFEKRASNIFYVMAKIYTVTPKEGTIGTIVTLEGDGFKASATVQIEFGTTKTITVVSTNASGTFTITFTVNTQQSGMTLIKAICPLNFATESFTIKSNITVVTPKVGTVGSIVTVCGNGFGASHTIHILFGTNNTITITSTYAQGSFSTTFTIDTQPYGTTTIVAYDINLIDVVAQNTYFIGPNIILVTPTEGTVGSLVTVAGNGFGGSEAIRIQFGTTPTITMITSGRCGSFSTTFTVDVQRIGTITITAWGIDTGTSAYSLLFKIIPKLIEITPTSGTVGTIVTLYGNGYLSNELVQIGFGTTLTITTTTVAEAGSITTTFTIDTQKYGTTTIKGTGINSNYPAYISFKIEPHIILVTPTKGTVGTVLTIAGNGFDDSETIRIEFGTTQTITLTLTDVYGSFSTTFTIDTQPFGTTTIIAHSVVLGIFAIDDTFIKQNLVFITPTSGTVGTIITIYGDGYHGTDLIQIDFGTTQTITTVSTNAGGSFTTTFTIDTQPYGWTTVKAIGLRTPIIYYEDYFNIQPNIIFISPTKGTVGTIITLKGNGYRASEIIRIEFGTTPTIQWTSTYAEGSFTTTFTIDTQPYSKTTIVAHGDVISASGTISILSNIIFITPIKGTVGAIITLRGNGYGASKTIHIDFGTRVNIRLASTYAEGSWTTTFTINTQPYGVTTIKVRGSEEAIGTITILPNIILINPPQGTVGSMVTVRGNGFGASETIHIHFGTTPSITTTSTGAFGSWTATFTVNLQPVGITTIKAVGINTDKWAVGTYCINAMLKVVTPNIGTVGRIVTVEGAGYMATECIRIDFGTTKSITFITTDGTGYFKTTFTIDTQPEGITTVMATGLRSNTNPSLTFVIVPGVIEPFIVTTFPPAS